VTDSLTSSRLPAIGPPSGGAAAGRKPDSSQRSFRFHAQKPKAGRRQHQGIEPSARHGRILPAKKLSQGVYFIATLSLGQLQLRAAGRIASLLAAPMAAPASGK